MEVTLFVIAAICVPVAVGTIFLYLRSSFALLVLLEQRHPDIWRGLGEPRKIWVRQSRGGIHTIQPIGPWLRWVWSGSMDGLQRPVALKLRQTRRLLRLGLAAFAAAVASILTLIAVAP